jgi:diaminohydroxyphosphoribosylaminopyrimidine deaminase / 5-amino-6-(5-phosphoribosylamino)uracil reductase
MIPETVLNGALAEAAVLSLFAPLLEVPDLVIGQVGQSLDGRIATVTGDSFHVGCPEALLHLHRLRALVDAVIVGIDTVLIDDPQLTVRHCPGPSPVRVIIDPRGRLTATARLLQAGPPVLVLTRAETVLPPGVCRLDLPHHEGRFAPADILAALRARGLRRLLVEGGAHTLSTFLAAGALDRLHVSVAPLLIGSGTPGFALPPVERLHQALRPATRTFPLGCDVLFDLDLRAEGPGG